MKLVKFEGNWADEMDVYGFKLMSEYEFENWQIAVKNCFSAADADVTYGCGSNEEIEWRNYDEFIQDIIITDISTPDAIFLKDVFKHSNIYGYGNFPSFEEEYYTDEYYARLNSTAS